MQWDTTQSMKLIYKSLISFDLYSNTNNNCVAGLDGLNLPLYNNSKSMWTKLQ